MRAKGTHASPKKHIYGRLCARREQPIICMYAYHLRRENAKTKRLWTTETSLAAVCVYMCVYTHIPITAIGTRYARIM